MKVIKKSTSCLLLVLVVMGLVGCAKEQVATYVIDEDNIKTEITLKAKGDEVYQQIAISHLSYDNLAVLDETEAKRKMTERAVSYDGIAGVKYDVGYKTERVVETITIDYQAAQWNELAEIEGFFISSADIKNGISFKGTVELLDSSGAQKISSEL